MGTNRTNISYVDGVAAFIDYAVHNSQKMGNIDPRGNKQHLLMPCPCTKYLNHIEHIVEEVQFHLFRNGIDLSYTKWNKHGEKDEPSISAPKPVNATTEFVDTVIKGHVRNKNKPEGCIAEETIVEETIEFF
ncbi:retrovirus-related pol polyprotein from transposon TNT 1-94 [Tanacetum coccineum]